MTTNPTHYRCEIKAFSRGPKRPRGSATKGGSNTHAVVAYRTGHNLYSERDGETKYCHGSRSRIAGSVLTGFGSKTSMVVSKNKELIQEFCDVVDAAETRKNSVVLREALLCLPQGITANESAIIMHDFQSQIFKEFELACLGSSHDIGGVNPHAHITMTTRVVNGKVMGEKQRAFNGSEGRETVKRIRKIAEECINRYFERTHSKKRVDCRSYKDQGIDIMPQLPKAGLPRKVEAYRTPIPGLIDEINTQILERNRLALIYYKERKEAAKEANRQLLLKKENTPSTNQKPKTVPIDMASLIDKEIKIVLDAEEAMYRQERTDIIGHPQDKRERQAEREKVLQGVWNKNRAKLLEGAKRIDARAVKIMDAWDGWIQAIGDALRHASKPASRLSMRRGLASLMKTSSGGDGGDTTSKQMSKDKDKDIHRPRSTPKKGKDDTPSI